MKILLINDSSSNPNWGDRAAAIALKKMLSKIGGQIIKAVTETDLYLSRFNNSDNNVAEHKTHKSIINAAKKFIPPLIIDIKQFISRAINNRSIIPNIWSQFEVYAELIIKNSEFTANMHRIISDADVVVIHGDGCMTGNNLIPRTQLFLTYVIKKYYSKPVIMINHTADFSHPILREIAVKVYPLFDDVVFRDNISLANCQDICSGRFAADTAFIFEPMPLSKLITVTRRDTYYDCWPDTANIDLEKPYICIGGSAAYPYIKGYDPIKSFYELIVYLQNTYNGQIVLTVSDGRDQDIFRPIAAHLNLPIIGLVTPVQQAVDIVGNADAYIGGRWHPSIFALRGGTPIIPISSNTFKMNAIVEMSGLSVEIFSATNLSHDKELIGQKLIDYLDDGKNLRNRLRKWADVTADTAWDNLSYLMTKQQ